MQLVVWIVGLAVAGGTLATYAAKGLLGLYRFVAKLDKVLTYVDGELRHNGGNSLRDHVVRISKRLEAGDATFAEHEARITALEGGPR